MTDKITITDWFIPFNDEGVLHIAVELNGFKFEGDLNAQNN